MKASLFIYGFTFGSKSFHLYGAVTIAGEGLQNLGYARRSGPLKGIFIVQHLR
jgi:hypothetical protein